MTRRKDDPARRGFDAPELEFDESQQGLDSCCPDCGSWRHLSCGDRPRRRGFGTAILGIGVLAVGAILLLDNFGFMDAEDIFTYWPVLLILVGVSHFVRPKGSRRYTAGSIFIFVGVVILLSNLGYIGFGIWDLWPVVLVILGANLLLCGVRRRIRRFEREGASK